MLEHQHIAGLLNLDTVDNLDKIVLCGEDCPGHGRVINNIPGLYPGPFSNINTIPPPRMCDQNCLLGGKITPVENYWVRKRDFSLLKGELANRQDFNSPSLPLSIPFLLLRFTPRALEGSGKRKKVALKSTVMSFNLFIDPVLPSSSAHSPSSSPSLATLAQPILLKWQQKQLEWFLSVIQQVLSTS